MSIHSVWRVIVHVDSYSQVIPPHKQLPTHQSIAVMAPLNRNNQSQPQHSRQLSAAARCSHAPCTPGSFRYCHASPNRTASAGRTLGLPSRRRWRWGRRRLSRSERARRRRSFLYSPEWVLAAGLDGQPAVPPAAWRTSPWQRRRLACRPSGPLPPGAPAVLQEQASWCASGCG